MLLAIDIGNTNIVLGLFDGQKLRHQFRLETLRSRTSDEYLVLLHGLLSMHGFDEKSVTSSIIASVVPTLTGAISDLVKKGFGVEALVVGPGTKTGMPILYENPKEVGADRIVNAVAAFERTKRSTIVVDLGTATTFDCVSPKGEYLGGVICPGIQISADALFSRAAKLPRVEIAVPTRVVGRTTVQSMQAGIVYGYVSLVDGLIARIEEELGYACDSIATGGLASIIQPLSKRITSVAEDLTLEGLRLLYERNPA